MTTSILPPPEFTPDGPPNYNSVKRDLYHIPSLKVWRDKNKFVQAAIRIEQHMEDPVHRNQPANEKLFRVMYARCKESSQFEPRISWACKDYVDMEKRMKWPNGYVQHYIAKWNVMPTEAFFRYVLYRTAHPFPGAGPTSTMSDASKRKYKPSRPQTSTKNCPPNKIVNPETGRCVLVTGKIGRRILTGK